MAISEANLRYNAAERSATDDRVAKNYAAANLDRGADGGPRMGPEIVMMTMSPRVRIGTRNCST